MAFPGASAHHTPRWRTAGVRAAAVFSVLTTLLLAACGSNTAGPQTLAQNQVFTWPYAGQASKIAYGAMLDPASLQYAADTGSINMLFVGLLSLDKGLNVQADAAAALPEIDTSGKVYTFHLRPNMKFSDGQPITAHDFAYSIDRALDPRLCDPTAFGGAINDHSFDGLTYGTGSPDPSPSPCGNVAAGYLNHILGADNKVNLTPSPRTAVPSLISDHDDATKGLSVIDPLTLRIRLDQPISYFMEAMTYPTSYAVEESFINKYPGGTWVDHLDQGGCSGPFKVQSYGNNSTQLTMVPNDAWETAWNAPITLTKVVRPVITSSDDAYTSYKQGLYDEVDVPNASFPTAQGQGDFHQTATLVTRYFGLNQKKAPFDNLQVRQAFALALNKQILVDGVTQGGATPTNHFVPAGMPGYDPSLVNPDADGTPSVTGNQDAAKKLLKQAQDSCPATVSRFDKTHDYCAYITGSSLLPIVVTYRDGKQTEEKIAKGAANQWSGALGLNVQAQSLDRHIFGRNISLPGAANNPLQMWNIGWLADYADPQDFLTNIFHTGALYNAFGISDPTLDQLMDQADKTLDQAKRMQMYNQAEQSV
ncbi:MAG TPA: peptide ABC transporter substrate-binding protein, partial [Ktedonobacterales bacterium]